MGFRCAWCKFIVCFVVAITRVSNVESLLYGGNGIQHRRHVSCQSATKSNSGFGESNRRKTEEKRSEPLSSGKRGFGISSSSKSSPVSSSSSSSSAAVSSNGKKLIDPGTVLKGTSQQKMENTIQTAIDTHQGLREMMTLQSELDDLKVSMSSMTDTDKSRLRNDVETKRDRVAQLGVENGWTDRTVSNKLHEITWDASAQFRDERHQSHDISYAMETHMRKVADWALKSAVNNDKQPLILDVGTGTGVLLKYLQQQFEILKSSDGSTSSSSRLYQQKNLVGIDLSSEMINICRATYPQATFHHGDFLDYKGLPSSHTLSHTASQTSSEKTDSETINDSESLGGLFDAVVFNECLHNFRDIENTLVHALSLLRLNGCVVVSHPRGFDNVFMQAGKNKWLCPSLLPSNNEWEDLALRLGAEAALVPNIKSPHYLGVLVKRK